MSDWPRLKFLSAEVENLGADSVLTTVQLAIRGSGTVAGTAKCSRGANVELRCAALATLDAVRRVVGTTEGGVEFLGVRSVKLFDTTIVIVAVAVPSEMRSRRVVGAYLSGEDLVRGAVIAVLNATNRYLGKTLFSV